MTVDFKSPVSSSNVNDSFMSRNDDTSTVGKVDLKNLDSDEVLDVQQTINDIETDATAVEARVTQNESDISDNADDIDTLGQSQNATQTQLDNHEAAYNQHFLADTYLNLASWAATATNGHKCFATDEKKTYQAIDGVLEPIGGGGGILAWESGEDYEVGDQVYYTDNNIYRCVVANSDTVWDAAKWQEMSAGVVDHNNLLNIQGGNAIERFHLTGQEYSDLQNKGADTKEATGFVNRTDSTLSFDEATRTLSVAPVASDFITYQYGKRIIHTATLSVVIPDVEGTHYVYIDATGTLVSSQAISVYQLITAERYVTSIYWDATNKREIIKGDERHGITMDGATHLLHHQEFGALLISGGAIGGIVTDADGSLDAHIQFNMSATAMKDEDIFMPHAARLVSENIPVFYQLGATGTWRSNINRPYPVVNTGTGRAAYNENVAGTWQLTEVPNADFVLAHVFVTNDPNNRYVAIMGQQTYTSQRKAREGALEEMKTLVTDGLPTEEFVAIATLIIQTKNTYTNTAKSRLRTTDTGEDYVSWVGKTINAGASANSHLELADLQGGDDAEYYHLKTAEYSDIQGATQTLTADGAMTNTTVILDGSSNSVNAAMPDHATFEHRALTVYSSDVTNETKITGTFANGDTEFIIRNANQPIELKPSASGWMVGNWSGSATEVIEECASFNGFISRGVGTRVLYRNNADDSSFGRILSLVTADHTLIEAKEKTVYTAVANSYMGGAGHVDMFHMNSAGAIIKRSYNLPSSTGAYGRPLVLTGLMEKGDRIYVTATDDQQDSDFTNFSITATAYETGVLVKTGTAAHHVGSAKWPVSAGHIWSRTGTTYGAYAIDNDAATPVVEGDIVVPEKGLPHFTIKNAIAGMTYNIVITGMFYTTGSDTNWALYDGSNYFGYALAYESTTAHANGTFHASYTALADGDVSLELHAVSGNGSATIYVNDHDRRFEIFVDATPSKDSLQDVHGFVKNAVIYEQEITADGYLSSSSGFIKFANLKSNTGGDLISFNNTGAYSTVVVEKACEIDFKANIHRTSANDYIQVLINEGGGNLKHSLTQGEGIYLAGGVSKLKVKAGALVYVKCSSTIQNTVFTNMTVTAKAIETGFIASSKAEISKNATKIIVGQEQVTGEASQGNGIDLGTGMQNTYKKTFVGSGSWTSGFTLGSIPSDSSIISSGGTWNNAYTVPYMMTATDFVYVTVFTGTVGMSVAGETLTSYHVTVEYYKPSETP